MDKQVVILDSTQLASFMECARLWNYEHHEHIVPIESGEKEAMTMGSYGHWLLENYYKERTKGLNPFSSKDIVKGLDVDDFHCTCSHKKDDHKNEWSSIDDMNTGMIADSCPCTKCNCIQWNPKPLPLAPDKRAIVRQKFEEHTLTYCNNDFEIQSPDQVERGFSYSLFENDEVLYILEGKIDLQNVTLKGQTLAFVDHKFQLRARDLYKKSIQFRNYGMVTNATLAMVNYIRMTQKVDKTTFSRQLISFAGEREHTWWKQRLIGIYDKVALALRLSAAAEDYWLTDESNPNWALCSGLFGYECRYTQLCNSQNIEYTKGLKQQLYKVGEAWTPW